MVPMLYNNDFSRKLWIGSFCSEKSEKKTGILNNMQLFWWWQRGDDDGGSGGGGCVGGDSSGGGGGSGIGGNNVSFLVSLIFL